MRWLLIAVFFFAVLFFGIWLIAVPDRLPADLLQRSFESSGINVEVIGMKKDLLYTFRMEHLIFRKADDVLLRIDDAEGKIDPLSLITLKLPLRVAGNIGGARISGQTDLLNGQDHIDLIIQDAQIESIPLVSLCGVKGRGLFSGTFKGGNNSGDVRFSIRDLRLDPVSFNGIPLPLDMFQSAKAALTIKNNKIGVDSLTLEGAGIYAKITGDIDGNTLNLVIELMPERSLRETMPLFALLKNYEVSPGRYLIVIKNSLSSKTLFQHRL